MHSVIIEDLVNGGTYEYFPPHDLNNPGEGGQRLAEQIPFIGCKYKGAKMKVNVEYCSDARKQKLREKALAGATPSTTIPAEMLSHLKPVFG